MDEPDSPMQPAPVLLATVSCPSLREITGAGPTTLRIDTWSDGMSRFHWLVNDAALGSAAFCINGFFSILQTLPGWFADVGTPMLYDVCDSDAAEPDRLVCVHAENYPEIGLGVIGPDATAPTSMVMLERGTVLNVLDTIGHLLAGLDGVTGCDGLDADDSEADAHAVGTREAINRGAARGAVDDADDPFAGLDINVRH